jgi:tRNA (guanosine-2'-O-)-methyltransferase
MNKEHLIKQLSEFVFERRRELFDKVLSCRTKYITLVLENIYQAQNASAVLRTSDCFGIQDIHVVQNRNEFRLDKEVTMGSDKWLDIYKYKNINGAVKHLKSEGYRIIGTVPGKDAVNLWDFDLKPGKIALLFGTELTGLTKSALNKCDEKLTIPMYGFTGSFNISVSVALILQALTRELHQTVDISWHLTEQEREDILLDWLRKTIKKSDLIEERLAR